MSTVRSDRPEREYWSMTLMVDGIPLKGPAILNALRSLPAHREDPMGWTASLIMTVQHLLGTGSGLPATTSGTTGPPKQFIIPRSDLVESARLTGSTFGLRSGDRVLHCLPCEFIAGKMMLVRAMVLGLDLHFNPPRGEVLTELGTTDRFRFAAMIPMQLDKAIHHDRSRVEAQFGTILLGGGPISERSLSAIQGLSTAVFEGYGSTETVTHVAIRPLNEAAREARSSGHALEDAKRSAGPGPFEAIGEVRFGRDPRGCLVIHTPHLSVDQHLTNDLIKWIDDRHFHWLGRADHVILSGGKKIHPEQLEQRTGDVLKYPHYFTSTPDDVLGEAVMLVIESDRAEAEVLPEVMDPLMTVLHPHEWPRRIQVLPRIRRTNSGKVIRR